MLDFSEEVSTEFIGGMGDDRVVAVEGVGDESLLFVVDVPLQDLGVLAEGLKMSEGRRWLFAHLGGAITNY